MIDLVRNIVIRLSGLMVIIGGHINSNKSVMPHSVVTNGKIRRNTEFTEYYQIYYGFENVSNTEYQKLILTIHLFRPNYWNI